MIIFNGSKSSGLEIPTYNPLDDSKNIQNHATNNDQITHSGSYTKGSYHTNESQNRDANIKETNVFNNKNSDTKDSNHDAITVSGLIPLLTKGRSSKLLDIHG